MRGELGLDIARRAEGCLVERVEILSDCAGCIYGIDGRRIPFFLRC